MVGSALSVAPAVASKKRQWRGGPEPELVRAKTHPLLAKCRAVWALEAASGETDSESLDLDLDTDVDMEVDMETSELQPALVDALPEELLALVLEWLDGRSLLTCAASCHALRALTFDRSVWKRLCLREWPSLRTQVLPQLPGAPDYDLVRLYGGSWRRCFAERHAREQRAEISVRIPRFSNAEVMRGVEKVVSDTFTIGEHHFCLWIFPNGNPNEAQYAGRVLSVYLVLTDLALRAPDWLTCAVFSLQVANAQDPTRRLEWHSCLGDNKFHRQLNNWGVHSLGALATLRDPQQGFLTPNDQQSQNRSESESEPDTLTVSAQVRLMTITFRVVRECDLRAHHQLGLVDLSHVVQLELPFCCSLRDLLTALHTRFPDLRSQGGPGDLRVWCFNQPVVSGQALRPRKLLTHAKAERDQPMFGHLLCDGVDIDAYSFCQIYVEGDTALDEPPLDQALAVPESSPGEETGYVFVKLLRPDSNRLDYIGKVRFPASLCEESAEKETQLQAGERKLAPSVVYEAVARHTGWSCAQLAMFREEIAPTTVSGLIPYHASPQAPALQPADILVFAVRLMRTPQTPPVLELGAVHELLLARYTEAQQLVGSSDLSPPTLEQVENLAEKLDIPKFRVRSAFRKCREDARATLRYVMEGRHLGFICDSCGETDFTGTRFNCVVCSDYDLCAACHAQCREVSHRYANVDGKWQRVHNFQGHKVSHAVREMVPVFFGFPQQHRPSVTTSSDCCRR